MSRFRTHFGISQASVFRNQFSSRNFHNLIRNILTGIDGVQNASDDILCMAKTEEELLKIVEKVFARLKQWGLTANEEKCEFGVKSFFSE